MADPQIRVSLLRDQEVMDSTAGQQIRLPCLVTSLTPLFTQDATVMSRVIPFLPVLYSPHPDHDNCPNATLRERILVSVNSSRECRLDLVYRAPGPQDWELEEISQSEYLQTFTTADGSKNLLVWYKSDPAFVGLGGFQVTPPVKAQAISVQRFFGKTVLRARGWMKYPEWQAIRKDVRSIRWSINKTQWGDDPVNDARGHWLFTQLITRTNDLNNTKQIELYFLNDPRGHFPLGVWYDQNGFHPGDGDSEQHVRSLGPPIENSLLMYNGISMFSTYPEKIFQNYFTFDPSQA